jgi:ribosomal protein S18 acetylase RimI-like enzyme
VKLVEWRSLPREAVARLYSFEERRWRAALGWDTAASWQTVETARTTWGLPGWLCVDMTGDVRGWTFYLPAEHAREIGGLFADTPEATDALVSAVLEGAAGAVTGFVYAAAPGLHEVLARRRVATTRYAYLARSTNRVPFGRPPDHLRAWRTHDLDAAATLLRDAYGDHGRLFAHDGSPDAWRTYVRQLVTYEGCGVLQPDLSRVAERDGRLQGLALVTSLGGDMAHLAQLAVAPEVRRSGLARTLLAEVLRSAHNAGYARMSLLVAQTNAPARGLYSAWGFEERGEFVALGTD